MCVESKLIKGSVIAWCRFQIKACAKRFGINYSWALVRKI